MVLSLSTGGKKCFTTITEAKKCLEFVVKTATPHGYLAEQIDNATMQPAWVIGLGWSHALFVITLERLLRVAE